MEEEFGRFVSRTYRDEYGLIKQLGRRFKDIEEKDLLKNTDETKI